MGLSPAWAWLADCGPSTEGLDTLPNYPVRNPLQGNGFGLPGANQTLPGPRARAGPPTRSAPGPQPAGPTVPPWRRCRRGPVRVQEPGRRERACSEASQVPTPLGLPLPLRGRPSKWPVPSPGSLIRGRPGPRGRPKWAQPRSPVTRRSSSTLWSPEYAFLAGLLSSLLGSGFSDREGALAGDHLCGAAVVGAVGDIEGAFRREELGNASNDERVR